MITIRDLDFSYKTKQVLKQLSVDINKDSFTSIIGPNGCGKTTLLKIIAGELDYLRGNIAIDERDNKSLSAQQRSKMLAFNRQQSGRIFPFTCLDYVLMGRRPHKQQFEDYNKDDLKVVEHAMQETETLEFVNKKLDEISGGELQRVNLARILAQDTDYVFCDESFSAMDIAYKHQMMSLLKGKTTQQKTVVSVVHDINLAYTYSDYVIVIKHGQLKAVGTPDDVLTVAQIREVFNIDVEYVKGKGYFIRRKQ